MRSSLHLMLLATACLPFGADMGGQEGSEKTGDGAAGDDGFDGGDGGAGDGGSGDGGSGDGGSDGGGSDGGGVDGGDGTDTGGAEEWSELSGQMAWDYGLSEVPGELDCSLRWDVVGAPASWTCEGCDFTFAAVATLDASSVGGEACGGWPDPLEFDLGYAPEGVLGPTLYMIVGESYYPFPVTEYGGGILLSESGPIDDPRSSPGLYLTDRWTWALELSP